MYGFKAGVKPGKAAGGKIRGPGTGTSDSIKAEVPEGSYIMPEDSTRQIGEGTLSRLGKPVPVNVSNGEYHMPPEQVHAVGAKVLDQMKNATHTPAPGPGFNPQEGALYFADGGRVKVAEQNQAPGLGFRIGAGAANYMRDMGDAWAADNAQFEAGNPGFMARAGRAINPLTGLGSAIGAARTAAQDGDLAGVGVAALGGVPAFGVMRAPAKGVAGMVSPGVDAARSAAAIGANTAVNVAGDYYDGSRLPDPVQKAAGAPPPDRSIFRLAEGFRPDAEMPRQGFADGGLVDDEKRRNVPVPQPTHGPQPAPDAKIQSPVARIQAEARERRDAERAANPGGPFTDINGFRTGGPSAQARTNSVPAAQLGQPEPSPNAGGLWSAVGNALTHSSDRAAMEQRQAARDETRRAAGRFGFMPQTPSRDVGVNTGFLQNTLQDFERTNGVNNSSSQPAGSGSGEVGRIAPPATNTNVPGVTRYDRPGESPLFSNVPSGGGIPGGDAERSSPLGLTRVSTVNMREGNETMARANAIRADTAALRQRMADGSAFARGDVAFRKLSPEEQQSRAASQATADMQSANYNMSRLQEDARRARFFGNTGSARAAEKQMDALHGERGDIRRQNESQARLGFDARRLGLDEQALAQRMQTDTAQLGLDARRLGLDERRLETEDRVRGFEARGLERMENLYQQLDKAETPEARASIAEQIRAISGRDAAEGAWKPVSLQGGTDSMGNKTESVLAAVNSRTGEMRRYDGGAQQGDISTDRRAIEIRDNPNMTRDQKVAALRALGYS